MKVFLSENVCSTSFYVLAQWCVPFHTGLIDYQVFSYFRTQVKF